ncbi:MAG: class I SAM-dependent methyltransferase [Deltaproteobacteria bacterium]|uniref:Class I SAM-dependent methyltransferase n=1 Tax=Candidatus Zymogenus saltonus TaxID=2844893 RepID=A0A9D8KEH7_9DELT|nr:class I SAM-dependent methyltransferase [Candidatus Zymogenus saltonus]
MSNENDVSLKEPTRWDKQFAQDDPEKWRRPSRLLAENIHLFGGGVVDDEGGRKWALDIACGPGRNSVFLAEHGFIVDAVDNSKTGIEMARAFAEERGEEVVENLNLIEADLGDFEIAPGRYDLIVNFYYLDRGLIPKMAAGLKEGGYLVFETFTREHGGFGEKSNPAHYLDPNEILGLVLNVSGGRKFKILYYREGSTFEEGLMRGAAQLIARRV